MKKNLIVVLFLSLITLAYLGSNTLVAEVKSSVPLKTTPPLLKLGEPLPANLFVELAKAINPSVVNISTSVIPRGRNYRDPMLEMLEQFYGAQPQYNTKPGKPQRMGLGTGFIIREDGLIVTNNHVIEGADIIEVQLTENSNKQFKAEVVGRDSRTDIALIKIKSDVKLSPAVLGSSDEAQVGEWVAAFGNPFGHGHSMTKGIISSKARDIGEINKFPLIQTDASINPGNSGGPLVNSKGLVIGVNSAIDPRAQGIGFAIPIDEVKKIIPILENNGSIRKGFLGINLGDIDYQAAQSLGLDEYRGGVVVGLGDGPGKKAGLKIYDIILEVNDKRIHDSNELRNIIADTEPGAKIRAKILRGEKTINLAITVAERPDDKKLSAVFSNKENNTDDDSDDSNPGQVDNSNTPFKLGAKISDLNAQLRNDYNIEATVKNPMITWIARGSIASRIGLRVGDVVLGINKIETLSANEAIKAFKKGSNTIRIARGRGLTVLTFDLK